MNVEQNAAAAERKRLKQHDGDAEQRYLAAHDRVRDLEKLLAELLGAVTVQVVEDAG